jgi:hypothetical protein
VTILEDRLREAYRELTDAVREEELPGMFERQGRTRRRPGRFRWNLFAPLAAAAAVVITVVLALSVSKLAAPDPARPDDPAAALPPYLLLIDNYNGQGGPLVVESAATGRTIATVPEPARHSMWFDAAPTGNPGTFIVAATLRQGGLCNPTYLYTLTLSASGRPVSVTPWTVPVVHQEIGQITASADGSTIAFVAFPCHGNQDEIGFIHGRAMRTWQAGLTGIPGMSLSADGSVLTYDTGGSVWQLDTGSTPGDAAMASKDIYDLAGNAMLPSVAVSADGSTLYLAWESGPNGFRMTGTMAAVRVGGLSHLPVFRRTVPAPSPDWTLYRVGDRIVALENQQYPYLVDPATGKLTRIPKVSAREWLLFW